jgi:hypothetical protein
MILNRPRCRSEVHPADFTRFPSRTWKPLPILVDGLATLRAGNGLINGYIPNWQSPNIGRKLTTDIAILNKLSV